ncbi:ATP-binding protein [Kitasatospora sp. NPDC048365]|uniref:ATP-binding protein n=1 Tax=Kitasatospora sp. NPDC048365 TaxID=3364050 RepID=UPI003724BB5A
MRPEQADGSGSGRRTGFAFVGRAAALGTFLEACRAAPTVVFVLGEAGIGKSRLIHEAARVLREEGTPVIQGGCHPLREPLPFGPVIDALSAAALPGGARLTARSALLAPYLPHLADRLPAPTSDDGRAGEYSPGGPTRNQVLMRAIHEVVAALGPVVLVVEDVHWADDATRDLLSLLARNPPDNLRLVLTYRPVDLPGAGAVLGSSYRRPVGVGGAEIALAPLSPEQIRVLAESAVGPAATPSLCRDLYERSGGLPLAAEEDLLVVADRLVRHGGGPIDLEDNGVPRALQEAVTSRLVPLGGDAKAVVEAAAVLTGPSSEDLLAAVAGLDGRRAEEALTEALRADVLTERGPGRYGFRHGLAHRAVYNGILGPRRRRLHAAAVDSLTARAEPAPVQIAHHIRRLGDTTAWITAAKEAVAHAEAVGDDGVTAGLLEQLLDEPALGPVDRGSCALTLSRIARYRSDPPAAAAVLRRILADPALDTATRGEIRLNLSFARGLSSMTVNEESLDELERAVAELVGNPEQAAAAMTALSLGSLISAGSGDATESLALMDRAARLADAGPDPSARTLVLINRITLLESLGDPSCRDLLARLPRTSADRGVLQLCARCLHDAAYLELSRGCDGVARSLVDEAEDICRRISSFYLLSSCRMIRLHLDLLGDHWDGLEERIGTVLRDTAENSTAHVGAHVARAILNTARGRWTSARETLTPLADAFTEQVGPQAVIALARIELLENRAAAAWQRLVPVIAAIRRSQIWVRPAALLPVAVRAALGCGLHSEAAELVAEADRGIEGRSAPGVVAAVDWSRAMLAADTDTLGALDLLHRARIRYEDIGRVHAAALVAEDAGRLRLTTAPEHPADAARDLQDAHAVFTRLGATVDAARCEQALRACGRPRPAPLPHATAGLSPRERQVAELLADGASNRHIAQALSLSPRTAEHHVAATLRKLGVTRAHVRDALGPAL